MMRFFRGDGGIAKYVGGAIVLAIVFVFAMEFRPGARTGGASLSSQCAIQVFDSCLDEKDFIASYRLMAPPGAEAKALKQIGLRAHVINGLVERELLVREAERLGIAVGEQDIDTRLTQGRAQISVPAAFSGDLSWQLGLCARPSSPVAQGCEPGSDLGVRLLPVTSSKTGEFDYKKYERVIRTTTNRGAKEFKEMQRRELMAERMRKLVRERVRVSEAEAWMVYERQRSEAVIRSVQIKRDWFAKWVADDSDAAVDSWAANNAEQVDNAWKSEQATFVTGCSLVSEILVEVLPGSDDEDKVKARARLDDLLDRVRRGEDFGVVAREASDGRTALIGGRLGCLGESYGEGSQELRDAAKKLGPGKLLSPVVESKRGFHVLRLDGVLAEGSVEKEGRRHVARSLAVRFQADELTRQFADDLIQRAQAGGKLDEITETLTREYAQRNPKRFSAKAKLKAKGPESAAEEPEEDLAKPPALRAPDRPRVEESAPFSVTSNPIPNAAPGDNPAVTAFGLAKPDAIHPKPIATDEGLVVMQLKEKTPAKREDFDKEKAELIGKLQAAKAADALIRYVARLRDAAKDQIKISTEITEEPKEQPGDG